MSGDEIEVTLVGPPSDYVLLDGDSVVDRVSALGADEAMSLLDLVRPGWRDRYQLFLKVGRSEPS